MEIQITLITLTALPNKRADVDVLLDGSLTGVKVSGIQIMHNASADDPERLAVFFPSRTFRKKEGGTGYVSYVRPVTEGNYAATDKLKEAILAAYHAEVARPAHARRKAPALRGTAAPPERPAGPRLVDPRAALRPARAAAPVVPIREALEASAEAAGLPQWVNPPEAASAPVPAAPVPAPAVPAVPATPEAPVPAPAAPRPRQRPARRPAAKARPKRRTPPARRPRAATGRKKATPKARKGGRR